LLGRDDEARAIVSEGLEIARAFPSVAQLLGIIAGEAAKLGVASDVVELVRLAPESPWREAAVAEASGERVRAADVYRGMGAPAIEADVRLGAAAALLEEGRVAEGLDELDKSLAFYRSVRATFFVEPVRSLIGWTIVASGIPVYLFWRRRRHE
jgi:hypothetical protein